MSTFRENVPAWLNAFGPHDKLRWDELLRSRVFFYPGSGLDGEPLRVFGASHACHCFIYVDCGIRNGQVHSGAERDEFGIRGYRVAAHSLVRLPEADAAGSAAVAHESLEGEGRGTFVVLDRADGYGDGHGPRRLAWLFLQAEAVRAFCILHGSRGLAPFGMLLRRYMGYDFIQSPDLERAARRFRCLPEFIQGPPDDDWSGHWLGYAKVAARHDRGSEAIYRLWGAEPSPS